MKNYKIEGLNEYNIENYIRVNAQSWQESYRGIVNDEFLNSMSDETEIQKGITNLRDSLNDASRRFLLKVNNEYAGILRVRKTKYENYSDCGELGALYILNKYKKKGFGRILFEKAIEELISMGYKNMVIGCLENNPTNEFYKYMGGIKVGTSPLHLSNQELIENIYYYDDIKNRINNQ